MSLTSVICKLLETIIRDHMMDFLLKHRLINHSQHGFLKARSCLTNLLCFFEEITKWVDEGSPVDIIYLDFQKAFDKVPHQRLILKLKSHGIGNSIINWIEQWLRPCSHLFRFAFRSRSGPVPLVRVAFTPAKIDRTRSGCGPVTRSHLFRSRSGTRTIPGC